MLIPSEIKITDCLFIDIETVAKEPNEIDLEIFKGHYLKETYKEEYEIRKMFLEQCALYPELGEICCISIGYVTGNTIVTKAFSGNNEIQLIRDAMDSFKRINASRDKIVAHNLKGFDHPFIVKRCSILGIKIPKSLQSFGKKPWEYNNLLDTFEVWKCGSFSGKGSMAALCNAYGIPSPKDEMDGSKVGEAFRRGEFVEIGKYCDKDVVALARLFVKMWEDNMSLEHNPQEMSIYNKLL